MSVIVADLSGNVLLRTEYSGCTIGSKWVCDRERRMKIESCLITKVLFQRICKGNTC